MLPVQVQFPSAARDFSPRVKFADSLKVSAHPRVQSHALTSVRMLKISYSMPEFSGLLKH